MVSALDSLLDDEARREEIGSRARDFVESEFSPRAIATRYLDLLAGAHAPEHLSQRRREAEVGEEGI
jgi:glycosyltransferase involved in cell wall biosynthesis